jgi:branched-subunit amino acid ABC-type transport system permease component
LSGLLPFVVAGLVSGAVYGLTAAGLVLTYKTSGIFDFAHGAIAAAGAYLFFQLRDEWGLPWPVAAALAVAVAGPLIGIALERLARSLGDATVAARIVATVGLLIGVQGLLAAIYGSASRSLASYLPTDTHSIGGINVGTDQLIVIAVSVGAVVALSAFLRRSVLGVAMRGVVDDPSLLDLAGTSPVRVRRLAWMIGASFAVLSGVLLAPSVGLDPLLLTLLVVQAFGAAAVGRFASLPLTMVGGLAIGVVAAVSSKYVGDVSFLSGLPPSLPFVVLFGSLLVARRGRFVEVGAAVRRTRAAVRLPSPPVAVTRFAVLGAVLFAVPWFAGVRLPVFISALIYALVFASLRLLIDTSGQVSLCHVAFLAIGATTFSHVTVGAGLPWLVGLLVAGAAAVPVGAVVAIPAIRLSGLFLALATLGFGVLLERLVYPLGIMFGSDGLAGGRRPRLGPIDGTSDRAFYWVCLAVVLAGLVATHLVTRSRLGRLLRAMSDSPLGLTSLGAGVDVSRVLVFCIAAFLAGVAGGLTSSFSGALSGISFTSLLSLTLVVVLAISGRGEVTAPVIAAGLLFVVPSYADSPTVSEYQPVFFGLAAIGAALLPNIRGSFDGIRADYRARAARRQSIDRWAVRAPRPAGAKGS